MEDTNYLYVYDYWIPFPSSEYGGVVIISAKNVEEANKIAVNFELNTHGQQYNVYDLVEKTSKNVIGVTQKNSGVVEVFIT